MTLTRWTGTMTSWGAAIASVLVLVAGGRAQQDAEKSKDHPMFSRMPGHYIEEYDAQDFSSVELSTDPPRKVEGRYWKISYWVKENGKKYGPVQIARNYTDLIVKQGGSKVSDDVDAGGGEAIAKLPIAGKNIWLDIDVSNGGEVYDL